MKSSSSFNLIKKQRYKGKKKYKIKTTLRDQIRRGNQKEMNNNEQNNFKYNL